MAVGILLAFFGLWLVLRSVVPDSGGQTLVDRIQNAGGPRSAKAAAK